jgi:hypothetical protein
VGRLFKQIRQAVLEDRFVASWHADEQCEEREISILELVVSIGGAELIRERPRSKPNPSVVLRQVMPDGRPVEVIWAWLEGSMRAKLVTAYFPD